MIRFCRQPDEPGVDVIDMRPDAEQPFCRLHFDYQHGQIPVPGMRGTYSESVTGLMEGLRLVGRPGLPGKVNLGYFVGPGRIRNVPPTHRCSGFRYCGRAVGLEDARRIILIPAYLWLLSNRVQGIVRRIQKQAEKRVTGLYDGVTSSDLSSPCRLSAAAILAAHLNGELADLKAGWAVHDN